MKKLLILIIFSCFLTNSYNQIKPHHPPSTKIKPVEVSFGDVSKAPDLHIKRLTAISEGDSVLFTLTYASKKDRRLSFFNPPRGSVIMYFNEKGIKKEDTITTFRIAKKILTSVDNITMRFSTPGLFERDGNFIFLSSNRDFLEASTSGEVITSQAIPIRINYTINTTAFDLQIRGLTAAAEGDQVKFTLSYSSQKDRSLQFFAPPNGETFSYVDYKGIKRGDSLAIFHIAKHKFQSVQNLQMRFSSNKNEGGDRNYIHLDLSEPSLRKLLGLHGETFAKKKTTNLFMETFIAPAYTIKLLITLCILIPLMIYVGNKANFHMAFIEKWVKNKWILFNIKTFIVNNITVLFILFFSGCFREPITVSLYGSLFIMVMLPFNLVFVVENIFSGRKKLFWLRQYVSILSLIGGLYFTYFLLYNITDGVFSKKGIYVEYVLLSGILIAVMRLINNYITRQKIEALKEKEFEVLRLNELKSRSDLMALQSKINPHFLYNALNSIAEICWKDAQKTERMALSLSKLFKYSLNKEHEDFNSLENEIELVNLYVTIEKERFGDHLNYQVEYNNDLKHMLIPKFILQPLIENAIKHGISEKPEGGMIRLTIKKIRNEVEINVFDNGPDFPINLISGYGLKSIHDKLDILYPGRYSIELYNGAEKNIAITLKNEL